MGTLEAFSGWSNLRGVTAAFIKSTLWSKSLSANLMIFIALFGFFSSAHAESGKDHENKPSFGVMIHFLPDKDHAKSQIESFDANHLARELKLIGAEYLIFTLGQNNGQYNSYNPVISDLCNEYFGPERNLAKDIADSLKKYEIKLILYLPFRAPQKDSYLMNCLNDTKEREKPPHSFLSKWKKIIRFWSEDLGGQLYGWWFDGAYNISGMEIEDWNSFCDAAKSGNSDRLIALNPGEGISKIIMKMTDCQNYSAGEINRLTPEIYSVPELKGMTLHLVTPLGSGWGKPGVSYIPNQIHEYINSAKKIHGMLTFDVSVDQYGVINSEQLSALKAATNVSSQIK